MIESIFSPREARKKPWLAFVIGIILTLVSILLVLQIGSSNLQGAGLGLLMVSFITIAATPLFLSIFRIEEEEDMRQRGNLYQRHRDVILVFAFFFLAVIFASSLFHVLVPKTSETVFFDQKNDLVSKGIISASALGNATIGNLTFFDILFNNLKVMALIFIFSFVFGAGAIFILSWNATVIGVLIAKTAETPMHFGYIPVIEGNVIANYLFALPMTLLRLLPHGLFEFLGYFIAAVAGGIMSVAIIREKLISEKELIFMDICKYMIIAVAFIIVGAAIEVL